MSTRRRWKIWPRSFIQELNSTSGLAALGGAILAVIAFGGWNVSSRPLTVIFGVLGVIIILAAIAIAASRAFPPALRNPESYVGQRLSLDKLDQFYPPLPKLGIVGPEMAGKSTVISRILQQAPPDQRTEEVHFFIAVLQTSPIRYLAMLDGPGQMFAGQFEIAALADILCVVVDHNKSSQDKSIDNSRVQSNIEFQDQLRGYLAKQNRKQKLVHLLLNKRDLWNDVSVSQSDKVYLKDFLVGETRKWKISNLASEVTSAEYSNFNHEDTVRLLERIDQSLGVNP